jgi:hypothetical protein
MAAIGDAAGRQQDLSPKILHQVQQYAAKAPLAPEPFLVHGALAQLAGRDSTAERLYVEARRRDPRSRAARYFLAERYLRTGRVEPALVEMAVLGGLTGTVGVFVPALSAYARTPGAVPHLRRFFRSAPEFEPAVLADLAADTKNLDLVFALWSGPLASPRSTQKDWQARMVAALANAGEFRRAHAAWRQFSGVGTVPTGVFNSEFRSSDAPPPFNWTFGSAGGLAQPAGRGQLDVIYFGREAAVLAQQLMLLEPGRYVLGMQVAGNIDPATELAWTIECVPQRRSILTLSVHRRSSGRLQGEFAIPAGCPAQQLQLSGAPSDFTRATEFSLSRFELSRAPG